MARAEFRRLIGEPVGSLIVGVRRKSGKIQRHRILGQYGMNRSVSIAEGAAKLAWVDILAANSRLLAAPPIFMAMPNSDDEDVPAVINRIDNDVRLNRM